MDNLVSQMIHDAHESLKNAYAPYSKYHVGCCICTIDDKLYTGVNVENGSYGLTICAEGSAICNMITAGDRLIKKVVILSSDNLLCPPCGACRQRIHEFSTPDTMIYLCNKDSILCEMTINELIPLAFDIKP
ncbi:cytidine deaminase [Legionella worsleiensis]|uniref:Cytidine deaminase n=1 Tax=Legionella worsleiensis TaxID=45076 RepID=A0A0W1A6F2_9GAMM|nr:cytidine deaminase [Legionella worsleiensis]KTD76923.1 cytidine deaminase [Legionella worsleiensis]STY33407.1 cytidine deaminase [Legionella worsleiensis]